MLATRPSKILAAADGKQHFFYLKMLATRSSKMLAAADGKQHLFYLIFKSKIYCKALL